MGAIEMPNKNKGDWATKEEMFPNPTNDPELAEEANLVIAELTSAGLLDVSELNGVTIYRATEAGIRYISGDFHRPKTFTSN